MRLLFLSFIALVALLPSTLRAQQLDNIYNDWYVFTLQQQGKKICYIASYPNRKTGNYKKRGEPYFLITNRSATVDEVSVSSGYPYKPTSKVVAKLDTKQSFDMFTSPEVPEVAWARDTTQDEKMVEALRKATTVSVRGTSQSGSFSEDRYSLNGISKAYQRMKSLCKK
ncbi:MAG: hypothetical protein EB060_09755 [Proteobacteria bacterium]|nr:hypothetical protein [Pseudomonadota bacterium]